MKTASVDKTNFESVLIILYPMLNLILIIVKNYSSCDCHMFIGHVYIHAWSMNLISKSTHRQPRYMHVLILF